MKKTRARYTDAYREEALILADPMGVAGAARDLGLQPSQLYTVACQGPAEEKHLWA